MAKDTSGFSQDGETDILIDLFKEIGTTTEKALEFGGSLGHKFGNTGYFSYNLKWDVHYWDREPQRDNVKKLFVTTENINKLMVDNDCVDLDLLSIDIDGNDYWIWKAIVQQPRVVIIEYNPNIEIDVPVTIPYDENHVFDQTAYHGASFAAMVKLGKEKRYYLYAATGINLVFVRKDIKIDPLPIKVAQRRDWPLGQTGRKWQSV